MADVPNLAMDGVLTTKPEKGMQQLHVHVCIFIVWTRL